MMISYCIGCKKCMPTLNPRKYLTKNKRMCMMGTCGICHKKKSTFLGNKQGSGLVNDLLNSGILPELHLLGHNYTGPGTQLKQRLLRGDKPINKLDAATREHDMEYAIFKDTKDRHVFDKKLQKAAFEIMRDPASTMKEKLEAAAVGSIMYGKRKLGLGMQKPV